MHDIEPYYNWQSIYIASEDDRSPFFGRKYSEFECTNTIYNYYIHPQWDEFGSNTLYLKVLYVNYDRHFCVIEMFGEWNDILYNDVMFFYRNVIEEMIAEDIRYFILIGENVLEFHADSADYYEEWADNLDDGWIICLNFRDHVIHEFMENGIDYYLGFGGRFNELPWRKYNPEQLFTIVDAMITKRLQA